jgi:membrane-associated phospholipid phosphatase
MTSVSKIYCTEYPLSVLLIQEQTASFRWTYLWMAFGGLILVLCALAFVYLVIKRRRDDFGRLLQHHALRRIDELLSKYIPGVWTIVRRRFTIRQWHGLELTVAVLVGSVSLLLFLMITESWTDQETLYAFDQQIYEWLVGSMNGQLIAFMRFITHFGDGLTATIISIALGVFLLFRRRNWLAVALTLSIGVGSAILWGLKSVFARDRPGNQLADALGQSFPSGHSFTAMALYGFVIYLVWRVTGNDVVRIGSTILLTLLIFLIGLSRVILRVHWVSDVAGGLTLGLAWLVCSLILTRTFQALLFPTRGLLQSELDQAEQIE